MTKHVTAILMAVMLLAQIGIAQHSTVHFTDHGHYEHHHDDHDDHQDHEKNAGETCQIYVIAKSLGLGLVNEKAELAINIVADRAFIKSHDHIDNNHQYALYNPRAPPVFLI